MPTTLVREVLWRASVMLQDADPQFTNHEERFMVDWLNDGQLAIASYLPTACSRTDVVRLQPGTKQSIEALAAVDVKVGGGAVSAIPVQGIQLVGLVRNMGADGATPGIAIPPAIDRRLLDTGRPNWHTVEGASVQHFVYNPLTPKQFYVQPAVPVGRLWVEMVYAAIPAKVPNPGNVYAYDGTDATTISIADDNLLDLVNYICARAILKVAESSADDTAQSEFSQLFLGSMNARVSAITGVNPNLKRLPFSPQPAGQAS